jgi:hypothetical protein
MQPTPTGINRTQTVQRQILRAALVAISAFALLVATLSAQADTKILLIGTEPDHPYATHMYLFDCRVLAKCLEQTAGIETVVSLGWPEDESVLEGVRGIVCYSRPAGDLVLTPPAREPFLKLMAEGAGYTAIHWATSAGYARLSDEARRTLQAEYRDVLGGWFRRPPGDVTTGSSRLKQLRPDHPICHGWKDYVIRDEFYLDLTFHERAEPLLEVETEGRKQIVAWTFERPNSQQGRSFGITLGHFHSNFGLEDFRKALINGILWTAQHEVPTAGAPVDLAEEDLRLPEQGN